MANRLKKPCSQIGCNALITTGARCPRHIKQQHVDYRKSRTDGEQQTFYNSKAWRGTSSMLKQLHPICQKCKVNKSSVVHHI